MEDHICNLRGSNVKTALCYHIRWIYTILIRVHFSSYYLWIWLILIAAGQTSSKSVVSPLENFKPSACLTQQLNNCYTIYESCLFICHLHDL
jgi:hypothetical protein